MNLQERGKKMAKKDFLNSLAQEVEDTKKGKEPSSKVTSFEEYDKQHQFVKDDNAILEDYIPEQHNEEKKAKKITKEEGLKHNDRPSSYQEEQLQKIEKKPVKIDKKVVIIGTVIVLLLMLAIYFIFLAPKIVVPAFEGKAMSELNAWIKQNEIDTTKIVVNEEFSLEYDENMIISQSVEAGKKIKKDTALTFVVSKGADPDENISFPDLMSMNYDEVKQWIDDNKLQKTKINTVYSDSVEENMVISYDLKNVNENNFIRGTNLTINISRGKAPAGQITIEDFKGKVYEEVETWAKNKKINLVKQETYSDSVEVGKVVSQSIDPNTTVSEQSELIVTVSKGKAVHIPNLVGYDASMLEAWLAQADTKIIPIKKTVYSNEAEGTVLSQSIAANSNVDQNSVLELEISAYLPGLFMEGESSQSLYGMDYISLTSKIDNWNSNGANIAIGKWMGEQCSDTYPTAGSIIDFECQDGNGNKLPYDVNGCARPLPLNAKISLKVSTGACTVAPVEPEKKTLDASGFSDFDTLNAYAQLNGITLIKLEDASVTTMTITDSNNKIVTTLVEGNSYIVKVPVVSEEIGG